MITLANPQPCAWFQCVALLRFDLEAGAVFDGIYPPSVLHEREQKDLLALAFPESHQIN